MTLQNFIIIILEIAVMMLKQPLRGKIHLKLPNKDGFTVSVLSSADYLLPK